ncbi:MAG: peptidoglycan D,D-transpeptidase FtsI family protein [bacterium]
MKSQRNVITRRALVVLLFLLVVFAVIILRFFQLMIIQPVKTDRWEKRTHHAYIHSQRGKIVDTNGTILATSVPRQSLYANPREVSNPWETARKLAGYLDLSATDIYRRLKKERYFVWLSRRLENHVVDQIKGLDLNGLGFIEESQRTYPQDHFAASVVGIVGVDNRGLEGLEREFDDLLRVEEENKETIPELKLTLDMGIQHIVEEELEHIAEKETPNWATVVMMQPQTGEIVAMAGWPSFDPNEFEKYSNHRFRNKAISYDFEPGSTLKVMTVGSGLADDAYDSRTEFTCPSEFHIEGTDHSLRCYTAHGDLTIPEILIKSCNVGTAKAVTRMSSEEFYQNMRAFGFGNWTGVKLPGEVQGTLRRPVHWSKLTQPSMAIGQGISVTALQLTNALSAIVNGGVLHRPQIVEKKTLPSGKTNRPDPVEIRRVMSRDIARELQSYMEKVVTRGTGQQAYSEQYRLAGKTGTAQKADIEAGGYHEDKVLASFIGFGPVEEPELAAAVIIDEPEEGRYGGEVAAPVFKKIMERSLEYLQRNS